MEGEDCFLSSPTPVIELDLACPMLTVEMVAMELVRTVKWRSMQNKKTEGC